MSKSKELTNKIEQLMVAKRMKNKVSFVSLRMMDADEKLSRLEFTCDDEKLIASYEQDRLNDARWMVKNLAAVVGCILTEREHLDEWLVFGLEMFESDLSVDYAVLDGGEYVSDEYYEELYTAVDVMADEFIRVATND